MPQFELMLRLLFPLLVKLKGHGYTFEVLLPPGIRRRYFNVHVGFQVLPWLFKPDTGTFSSEGFMERVKEVSLFFSVSLAPSMH
jgi:hypothetical protein